MQFRSLPHRIETFNPPHILPLPIVHAADVFNLITKSGKLTEITKSTYGHNDSLEQLITTTIQTIEQQESIIQQLSHEYVADYQEKKLVEQKCKDILDKARMKVHEEIDRIYDRYVIDVQEKINFYNQELDQLYGVVEQALHKMYSELTANKEGLSLFNKDASYSSSPSPLAKPGRTQRPQIYTFTPENTNMNYRLFQQQQRNQTKKQDRKIMKILIELQSNNATEVNYRKIEKIRKQIDELKHYEFVMNVNWSRISKYLSNLCQETIQVKSVSEGDKYKSGTQVKIVNENRIGSESSIENNSRDEIGEIMRNTNERISKMQLSSNRVKQSPSKLQNMGNKERKPNFRPQRV